MSELRWRSEVATVQGPAVGMDESGGGLDRHKWRCDESAKRLEKMVRCYLVLGIWQLISLVVIVSTLYINDHLTMNAP